MKEKPPPIPNGVCPVCGRDLSRGEMRCQRCDAVIGIDMFGASRDIEEYRLAQAFATMALFLPGFGAFAILASLACLTLHDNTELFLKGLTTATVAVAVGTYYNFTLL